MLFGSVSFIAGAHILSHVYSVLMIRIDERFNLPLFLSVVIVFVVLVVALSRRFGAIIKKLVDQNRILKVDIEALKEQNARLTEQNSLIRKEHNDSDKFYGMLVQSADDGISFYDSSLNLKYANAAFYSLIGLDRNEYHSIDPVSLVHPEDRDYHDRRIKSLAETGFFESELRLLHKNGHFLHLSTRSVVVRNDEGSVIGSLTISRDITNQKKVLNDLVKANEVAEASSRLKSSFLANISHEIRTPLNSVVGFSNLLLAEDISGETRAEYVEHINYNSEKLLQIIGDIIDLSRLESSQIEISYEGTSINSLIDEIASDTRQSIKRNEKALILNVRNSLNGNCDLVFTDRIWLKRVLCHLLDNAVKFTPDGYIDFCCSLDSDKLVFKVRDTGVGISRENLNHIFEEFRQEIDGHQRPFEGLGVGLTLVKEVVERMGGSIFVQSEKGSGSEFGFSIPYRPAGSGGTRRNEKPVDDNYLGNIDWKGRKCLLVDDNNDVLVYLKRLLADTGIEILTSHSGYEALQLIRYTKDIDIVLLDLQMPGLNGIEVAKEIRKLRNDLPVIAQTAFIFEDDKDIILEAGCDACLLKPIRRDHLLSVMKGLLR